MSIDNRKASVFSIHLFTCTVNKHTCVSCCTFAEHITQSIVKSHLETCQYSVEDMKRFTWVQYSTEETRVYQNKVRVVDSRKGAKNSPFRRSV